MSGADTVIENHYARADLYEAILAGLRQAGKDLSNLAPADLAPVDAFHVRGREATRELSRLCALRPGLRVLDVGCGLGGSARYLAGECGCRVTGLDLTADYCRVGRLLSERVGLAGRVDFRLGSALALPFRAASFDVVWTEHAQMNILDKPRLYGEMARVLKPGGRLAFHDIFAGPAGDPRYPLPWANEASYSFLAAPEAVRSLLGRLGLRPLHWEDATLKARDWYRAALERITARGLPPLGLHLLMGAASRDKLENALHGTEQGRLTFVLAVAEKAG
jgi:ubiquinone/menaquinone biosynthesis C-methylase UbiE